MERRGRMGTAGGGATSDGEDWRRIAVRWIHTHALYSMATVLKRDAAPLDKAFCEALSGLSQVQRVVVVHVGPEPSFVVTVSGEWVDEVPAIHQALRPLRRRNDLAFRYRTVRESWREPDPTPSVVLYARP